LLFYLKKAYYRECTRAKSRDTMQPSCLCA
jgi:hypothetical protein